MFILNLTLWAFALPTWGAKLHDARGPCTSENIFTHLSKLFSVKSLEPALLLQFNEIGFFRTKKCPTRAQVEIFLHALFHYRLSFWHQFCSHGFPVTTATFGWSQCSQQAPSFLKLAALMKSTAFLSFPCSLSFASPWLIKCPVEEPYYLPNLSLLLKSMSGPRESIAHTVMSS